MMSKSELRRLNIQFEAKIAQLEAELAERGRLVSEWGMKISILKGELAAHRDNEGDECPLCILEAENEKLKGYISTHYGAIVLAHVLKEEDDA